MLLGLLAALVLMLCGCSAPDVHLPEQVDLFQGDSFPWPRQWSGTGETDTASAALLLTAGDNNIITFESADPAVAVVDGRASSTRPLLSRDDSYSYMSCLWYSAQVAVNVTEPAGRFLYMESTLDLSRGRPAVSTCAARRESVLGAVCGGDPAMVSVSADGTWPPCRRALPPSPPRRRQFSHRPVRGGRGDPGAGRAGVPARTLCLTGLVLGAQDLAGQRGGSHLAQRPCRGPVSADGTVTALTPRRYRSWPKSLARLPAAVTVSGERHSGECNCRNCRHSRPPPQDRHGGNSPPESATLRRPPPRPQQPRKVRLRNLPPPGDCRPGSGLSTPENCWRRVKLYGDPLRPRP